MLDVLGLLKYLRRCGYKWSRATLYRRIADDKFPKPVEFRWPRAYWKQEAVDLWITNDMIRYLSVGNPPFE
ncbi:MULTISPECIES: helix-turn-helix transcriptional regulator [Sphingomonas]|uniref:helix-turn-helix transcriptional regulator n=1 Tax=Sphingomonas TaxID=13687 RepID=UPI0012698D59|nr:MULTISPECIES: AlpA family phage regulatory protein [Sphingomonas]